MQIVVNGETLDAPERDSVAALLQRLATAGGQRIAIELNGDILPRSEWSTRILSDADRVEIVRAIGGG